MNGGASGLRAGRQLFGRRPARAQGARRTRQQHTAARAAGGNRVAGSGSGSAGPAAGSRFGWAKWVLLPAAASALFGGKAAADAYSAVQTQLDVEAGHKRAERRWGSSTCSFCVLNRPSRRPADHCTGYFCCCVALVSVAPASTFARAPVPACVVAQPGGGTRLD